MTALEVLKKVRKEMRPNSKPGEYELPVILKAMHDYSNLVNEQLNAELEECRNILKDPEALSDYIGGM